MDYYMRFTREKKDMPVLWHQSLLVFVQRYKNDIREDQKEVVVDRHQTPMTDLLSLLLGLFRVRDPRLAPAPPALPGHESPL